MRKITVSLDPESLDHAIRELEDYKRELKFKINMLVAALTNEGIEIAKSEVRELGAVFTGELESSIFGYFNPTTGIGIVRAGVWYAVYVEFGTGVVGQGLPHPDPKGWRYDVNNHGEQGWWYFNERDGRWHWTQGFRSRPFMYNTVQRLEQECPWIAKEVFGR